MIWESCLSFLRRFGLFWYDFIVGDAWEVAAGVVLALFAAWAVIELAPGLDEALGPVLVVGIAAVLGVSLVRAEQ